MKATKKVLSILLSTALMLGMTSCGANAGQDEAAVNNALQYAAAEGVPNNDFGGNYAMDSEEKAAYEEALQAALENYRGDYAADDALAEAEAAASAASKAAAEASKAAAGTHEAMPARQTTSAAVSATTAVSPSVQIPSEVYGKLIENPFISTANNNISTFSADVDTASYTYFRKLMSYGWSMDEIIRQAGSSIRTEEMINYFDYSYAEPKAGELFGVKTQIAQCPWNEEAVLLQIGLKADDAVSTKGNNLVFLIDVSGSMNTQDKLPLLKTAFTYLTETLSSNDTVSIVTYAGRDSVVLEGCNGTFTDQILKAVNNLTSGGSTNGQAGLQRAYEIAAKYYIEGGNNRIILASDGDLNVGIRSPEELKKFVSEKRDGGIYLTTLGFGTGNYRDANMEALANHGNGVYYYIDGASEAEKVFGTDLLATLYTVAEDVKMQITFDPQYIAKYRLVGYENRLLDVEDFEDDTKDAGEVGAGHTVTVCYELMLTDQAKKPTAGMDLMKLAIRHKAPGEDQSRLNEYTVSGDAYTDAPDHDFQFICAVTELSMILHESDYTDKSAIADLYATLNSLPLSDDSYKLEFRDMVTKLVK